MCVCVFLVFPRGLLLLLLLLWIPNGMVFHLIVVVVVGSNLSVQKCEEIPWQRRTVVVRKKCPFVSVKDSPNISI